jgi:hypothetical protein
MYLLFTVYGAGRNDFDADKSMSKTIGSGKSRLFGPKKVLIFQGPPLPTALKMAEPKKVSIFRAHHFQ